MMQTTFGFLGLGLIGGSIAKALKRVYGNSAVILAFDTDETTLSLAKQEGVIDIICQNIDASFSGCRYLFLCAPVSVNVKNLTKVRDFLSPSCIITDVGSVKSDVHKAIDSLGLSKNFIGGHPMAGSEKSSYANANERLMENAYYILTPTDCVPKDAISDYYDLILSLGSIPLILDYKKHDYITAAISHLPHIIAAALVNLVNASDDADGYMKMIAAGGFKDITRIASSSADMWQQISLMNKDNISLLLNDYISSLQSIENDLRLSQEENLYSLFSDARQYRDSFTDASSGPIKKVHAFYVDIPDEPGVIAAIATILALQSINIKNIGIVHNREFEEGVLRIEFYDETSLSSAAKILQDKSYGVYRR